MEFTDDNTEGFTADELRAMNKAYRLLMADEDTSSRNIADIAKQLSDDIHDSVATIGVMDDAAKIVAHIRWLQQQRRQVLGL